MTPFVQHCSPSLRERAFKQYDLSGSEFGVKGSGLNFSFKRAI